MDKKELKIKGDLFGYYFFILVFKSSESGFRSLRIKSIFDIGLTLSIQSLSTFFTKSKPIEISHTPIFFNF